MASIEFLHELSSEDIVRHGGKTIGLARLIAMGVPVPPGFSISYDYFERLLDETPAIRRIINEIVSSEDVDKILKYALQIEQLVNDYVLPEDVKTDIGEALERLRARCKSDTGYAVRSSASVEDSKIVSFAGQAESFLAVKTLDRVLQAVKNVWRSVLAVNSILYLKSMGISPNAVKMAVLVQEMIDADVSGVMFTADTVNANLSKIIVQSTWGLCESLVSGQVIPDTYIVDKSTHTVIDVRIGSKQIERHIKKEAEGTTTNRTDPKRCTARTLDDSQVIRIADLGCHIEKQLGGPQDIEWCMRGDQLLVVQCRPVTALKVPRVSQ